MENDKIEYRRLPKTRSSAYRKKTMLYSTSPRLPSQTDVGNNATSASRGVTAWYTTVVYGDKLAADEGWNTAFFCGGSITRLGSTLASGAAAFPRVLERDLEFEGLAECALGSVLVPGPVWIGVVEREVAADKTCGLWAGRLFADLGLAGKDVSVGLKRGEYGVVVVNSSVRRGCADGGVIADLIHRKFERSRA